MPAYTTEDSRWDAVNSRQKDADGLFYYGVLSTGVYCIPSCPSRPKKRENIQFFDTRSHAEKAGYRPCKRCKPETDSLTGQTSAIIKACRMIEEAEETPKLDSLANAVGLSSSHFHRVFKDLVGITPKKYAEAHRAGKLKETLQDAASVTGAVFEAGFGAISRFYETAESRLGMPPKSYRANGKGESIQFSVGECSLGAILVAATPKGVCAIDIGDSAEDLVAAFTCKFKNAQLTANDPAFNALLAKAVRLADNPSTATDLPLDIQGTAFQQKIWSLLQDIPAGRTITYSELATRAGNAKAVRAAASACAANKIAIAVPCHRVVRMGGALSGYRWGIDRKASLLAKEAAQAPVQQDD